MRIVLPGAWPPAAAAQELAAHLSSAAPALHGWLQRSHARIVPADPAISGCTPYEQWCLSIHGFRPEAGQNFATGMAPLLAQGHVNHHDRAVWLAELVHIAPARDGAVLIPAADLEISPAHSQALFESAHSFFAEEGFGLHACSAQHWRIDLPPDFKPDSATPALVRLSSLNDWWTQDVAGRPWRRLVNALQMLWFDHPVNQERAQQGLMPVNSLWLFGGARPDQITRTNLPGKTSVHTELETPLMKQDWGGWLHAMTRLDQEVIAPVVSTSLTELVLTGTTGYVELTPSASWRRWIPGTNNRWRTWWSSQN